MKKMKNSLGRTLRSGMALACTVAAPFVMPAAEQPWNEGVLDVAQGNVVNLTKDYATNYIATASGTAVTLHGDMAVTSPHYFVYCWDGSGGVQAKTVYMYLGGESGDTGRLSLDGCALDSFYSNGRRLQIFDSAMRSPDDAAISLSNRSTLTLGQIVVDAVCSTGDYLTELDIGANCQIDLTGIRTRSQTPVKIRFSGANAKIRGWTINASTDAPIFTMVKSACGGFLVEGGEDAPIDIESWPTGGVPQRLLANDNNSAAKLVFQGDCDVRLVSNRNKAPIVINHANIEFRQTGDLVLAGPSGGGCATQVRVENVLPHGVGVGIVRVESIANKPTHMLDLCGGSQKLNGLVLENGSQVVCTNGAVTLTFGTENVDGVLDGLVSADVSIVKTGAGTLTVTNATVASVAVSNGVLTVDGGVLTCGRLDTAGSGRVTCINGGRIATGSGSATWEIPAADDNLHAISPSSAPEVGGLGLYYGGTTAMTYLDGGMFGDVKVRSGTLRIGGTLVSDLYWRFTFTGGDGGNVSAKWDDDSSQSSRFVSLALGRLHPLSVDGTAVNVGSNDEGHFDSETTPAKATTASWSLNNKVTYLGWSLSARNCVGFTTAVLSAENPIVVTVKTTVPIWGYGMSRAGNCDVGEPSAWTVESSADGETGWTLRDERTGQAGRSVNMGYEDYGNDGLAYPLSAGVASSFCATGCVEVAAGATLNLSEIAPERISIQGIRLDASSGTGGTITRFVPAANGRAVIDNVPAEALDADGKLKAKLALYAVGEAFNEDRLSGWSVSVNGKAAKIRLKMADGILYAVPARGFIITVQ